MPRAEPSLRCVLRQSGNELRGLTPGQGQLAMSCRAGFIGGTASGPKVGSDDLPILVISRREVASSSAYSIQVDDLHLN
jgi:hypothetical protein